MALLVETCKGLINQGAEVFDQLEIKNKSFLYYENLDKKLKYLKEIFATKIYFQESFLKNKLTTYFIWLLKLKLVLVSPTHTLPLSQILEEHIAC